jgi:membrane protein YqaA with SNARE-associated domain
MREESKIGLQIVGGLLALFALIGTLAATFRSELESLGRGFVTHFGVVGMAIGTFLADGLHFPIPPQFYMLAAISSRTDPVPAFTAICVGSLIGGVTAFVLAGHAGKLPFLRRRVERSSKRVDALFRRWGYWAVAIGSVTPVPFSFLCYIAGIYRMPRAVFGALALFRIPRLLTFWLVIWLGWRA